ncbi:hypothetical protein [Alloalcanivorax xenomutans]|uniref:hypothetical protein n=1 Tax=Alloalcanivorax xenomutans TaxID=1094342 RepID=UPI003BAB4526
MKDRDVNVCQLYKIFLSQSEYEFRNVGENEVEILFENCTSRLNVGALGRDPGVIIHAESIWGETGERIKDTVTVLGEVVSPNYPPSKGYKTFHVAWDSGGEVDEGYVVLKCWIAKV